jgi:dihydrofolate reductase
MCYKHHVPSFLFSLYNLYLYTFKMVDIVVSVSNEFAIGKNTVIPWNLSFPDIEYFRKITTDQADNKNNKNNTNSKRIPTVIMGRHTWENVPLYRKPMEDRRNIVLSSNKEFALHMKQNYPNVLVCDSIEDVMDSIPILHGKIYVIGGEKCFKSFLAIPGLVKHIYMTRTNVDVKDADCFFPDIQKDNNYKCIKKGEEQTFGGMSFRFETWKNNHA